MQIYILYVYIPTENTYEHTDNTGERDEMRIC